MTSDVATVTPPKGGMLAPGIDPVRFEVIRNALLAITEEMGRWGDVEPGPAVIWEVDSTTVLHPGHEAHADQYGNLLLRRR